MAYWIYLEF